jgi:hypothetical protein
LLNSLLARDPAEALLGQVNGAGARRVRE